MSLRPSILFALKWGICLLLLGVILSRVNLAELWAHLRLVHVGWLLAGLALCLVNTLCAASQFKRGLDLLEMPLGFGRVVEIVLISAFYSVVVPAGMVAGGLASFYKFTRGRRKFLEAGVLVVMFRLLNTLVLLVIGLAGAWGDARLLNGEGRLWLALCGLALLTGCLPWLIPSLAAHLARLPAPRRISDLLRDGAAVLARFTPASRLHILGWGTLINATNLFAWVCLGYAAGIQLGLGTLVWIAAFQGIVQMLPFTIGGLGVREMTLVALLNPYGVPPEQALVFSSLILLVLMLNTLAGGILELVDRPHRLSPQPA